jgi:hypothetical protein
MNMGIQHYILRPYQEMPSCVICFLWQGLRVRQPIQLDALLLRWQLLWVRVPPCIQTEFCIIRHFEFIHLLHQLFTN